MYKIQTVITDERLRQYPLVYQTSGAAGIDLRACIPEPLELLPGMCLTISAGFRLHLKDPGLAAIILPRSGLGAKHGIILGNSVGLIDSDYTGEIMITPYNRSSQTFYLNPMDRIAQLVIIPVLQVELQEVAEFRATRRGDGRLGSTGVK